jgi:hypothetical protein
MSLSFHIRAPFIDELPRVIQLLPQVSSPQNVRLAVTGRVERIAAAAALYFPEPRRSPGLLKFTPSTADFAPEMLAELLAPLAEEAANAGASEVFLVGSVAEDHPLAALLEQEGFERYRQTEVYRLNPATVLERVEPLYQRLLSRKIIPRTARAVAPRGALLPKLRLFLEVHQRNLSDRLEADEGFTLEHSLVLLLENRIEGVFFTRNRGPDSYIGLILLAQELRGGLAWANTFMMREMLRFGLENGVERLFFEVHQQDHQGSHHIARRGGGELICRRWQFRRQFFAR